MSARCFRPIRMACAFGGGLAISVGMPILVGTFDTEAEGYLWSMLIFAALATPVARADVRANRGAHSTARGAAAGDS